MSGDRPSKFRAHYPGTVSPPTPPPGSHTHFESDVIDLDADLASLAPIASPTFTGTVSGVTKTMVGLGSVDNTADTAKPVSTAQQTALDLKAADNAVVKLTGAQTVAGKKTLSSQVALPQIATPAAAAAGTGEIYFKTNGLPYYMNPAGVEVQFSVGEVVSALHGNPDFEDQTAGVPDVWSFFWQINGATTSTTSQALSGSRSALVTLSADGIQQVQSDVLTVAAGDVIEFSVFAKAATGAPTITLSLQTKASGTPDFFDANTTPQSGATSALKFTYAKYSGSFSVPFGHTVARLVLTIAAPAAATAYLDNSASSKSTGAEAWASYTPTWSGTLGNGTLVGKSTRIGKTVHYRIQLTWGSSTSHAATTQSFALPAAAHADYVANMHMGNGLALDLSAVTFNNLTAGWLSASGIYVLGTANTSISNTVPWTWASGDKLSISGTYETA